LINKKPKQETDPEEKSQIFLLTHKEISKWNSSLTNMCSANQPSLLARMDPSLRAKHFLPSSEFPP